MEKLKNICSFYKDGLIEREVAASEIKDFLVNDYGISSVMFDLSIVDSKGAPFYLSYVPRKIDKVITLEILLDEALFKDFEPERTVEIARCIEETINQVSKLYYSVFKRLETRDFNNMDAILVAIEAQNIAIGGFRQFVSDDLGEAYAHASEKVAELNAQVSEEEISSREAIEVVRLSGIIPVAVMDALVAYVKASGELYVEGGDVCEVNFQYNIAASYTADTNFNVHAKEEIAISPTRDIDNPHGF